MEKRVRSPNYPALSLKEAIDKLTLLYKNNHRHAAPREAVAKGMGYGGLSGASATAISALNKYGLLEKLGEDLRVSERGMQILAPHSPQERATALIEAAYEPRLFAELRERFPGQQMPNADILKNFLVRNGFAPAAVTAALLAYRETVEFVNTEAAGYDSAMTNAEREPQSLQTHTVQPSLARPLPPAIDADDDYEEIGGLGFKGVGFVKITATPGLSPEKALNMAQQIINMMKDELKSSATEDISKN